MTWLRTVLIILALIRTHAKFITKADIHEKAMFDKKKAITLDEYLATVASRKGKGNARHKESTSHRELPCLSCDFSKVFVPPAVAWVHLGGPNYLNELFGIENPELLVRYWPRVEQAVMANAAASKDLTPPMSLHSVCSLPYHVPDAIAKLSMAKLEAGRGKGVLLYFRGDSHTRVTFLAVARSMTRDPETVMSLNLDASVQQADHLFCCAGMSASDRSFTNCTLESGAAIKNIKYSPERGVYGDVISDGNFHPSNMSARARGRVEAGSACVAWTNRNYFREGDQRVEWRRGRHEEGLGDTHFSRRRFTPSTLLLVALLHPNRRTHVRREFPPSMGRSWSGPRFGGGERGPALPKRGILSILCSM